MIFQYPTALLLLIFIPVMVAVMIWSVRRRGLLLQQIGDPRLLALLHGQTSLIWRAWKFVLWLAAFAMLVLALARPVWGVRTDVVEAQGVSVMLVLDVSDSMNAEDILPTRLERAKLSIRDMLDGIAGNEVGMIIFAGRAFTMFPLTSDVESAVTFLNTATSASISQQGTAIGTALDLALDAFSERTATEQAIIVLTDGEDHGSQLDAALQRAIQQDVTVHVIGFGTQGGGSIPIRNRDGEIIGNKTDRQGNVVISVLDESLLQGIAQQTGGIYQRYDPAGQAIRNLVQWVNAAEAGRLESREETRGVERFGLFVAIALVLLSLEILLPERGRDVS